MIQQRTFKASPPSDIPTLYRPVEVNLYPWGKDKDEDSLARQLVSAFGQGFAASTLSDQLDETLPYHDDHALGDLGVRAPSLAKIFSVPCWCSHPFSPLLVAFVSTA